MDTIGLDLHKRESQLCIIAGNGTVTERRIVTSRERFTAVLGNRAPERILLEASTETEWVARPPRGARPHGHRRGSELCADVRDAHAAREDGQARCTDAG